MKTWQGSGGACGQKKGLVGQQAPWSGQGACVAEENLWRTWREQSYVRHGAVHGAMLHGAAHLAHAARDVHELLRHPCDARPAARRHALMHARHDGHARPVLSDDGGAVGGDGGVADDTGRLELRVELVRDGRVVLGAVDDE